MDRTGFTRIADRYLALRGLYLLPTGLLFTVSGTFGLLPVGEEAPFESSMAEGRPFLQIAAGLLVVLALAGYYLAHRYYQANFGRVERSNRAKVREALVTGLGVAAIMAGTVLDFELNLPVSLYGAAFGLYLLVYYRSAVPLRRYHWLLLGGLAVVCLLPIWGGISDTLSVTLLIMGPVTAATGVFDHRELVASLRQARLDAAGSVDVSA